ncbi:alpha/beta fold hydrolase [Oceanobacillus sp. M65]|uniref:alpha/beta fold hydrolase n=1 Tax=Oceanobacillus sp. M65 TaxID=3457435 RepID=UPI003FCE2E05
MSILHGGPGYWSKSFQHFARDLLEENLQMIYLDQRGCGRSEHSPIQDYSLKRVVEDIEALRIHLGIEEWWIIGHSFGGILAVNYASKFPNRMKGMILSNVTLHMLASFQHQIIRGASLLKKDVPEIDTLSLESFIKTCYEILTSLLENEVYFSFQYSDLEMKKEVDLIECFHQKIIFEIFR